MARPRQKLDLLGQADRVASLLKSEPPGWRRECLLAVQLGFQGEQSLDQIATATGRSRSTIQEWFDAYRRGGVDALLKDGRAENAGAPSKLTVTARPDLQAGHKPRRSRTAPKMRDWLSTQHTPQMAFSSLSN